MSRHLDRLPYKIRYSYSKISTGQVSPPSPTSLSASHPSLSSESIFILNANTMHQYSTLRLYETELCNMLLKTGTTPQHSKSLNLLSLIFIGDQDRLVASRIRRLYHSRGHQRNIMSRSLKTHEDFPSSSPPLLLTARHSATPTYTVGFLVNSSDFQDDTLHVLSSSKSNIQHLTAAV
ncbi:hypothetical protein CPB83DRAFT_898053 [Crepidotus variabilis]|uniref:Uncharacterized protein n=1 Tax=Crepidotus variabilis TaxID=179855 RepID=A0A9P6E7X4_9AGAR|nr:hypothetical protein CPB83DRAFT_898053 [Crepidotus variabilis]